MRRRHGGEGIFRACGGRDGGCCGGRRSPQRSAGVGRQRVDAGDNCTAARARHGGSSTVLRRGDCDGGGSCRASWVSLLVAIIRWRSTKTVFCGWGRNSTASSAPATRRNTRPVKVDCRAQRRQAHRGDCGGHLDFRITKDGVLLAWGDNSVPARHGPDHDADHDATPIDTTAIPPGAPCLGGRGPLPYDRNRQHRRALRVGRPKGELGDGTEADRPTPGA